MAQLSGDGGFHRNLAICVLLEGAIIGICDGTSSSGRLRTPSLARLTRNIVIGPLRKMTHPRGLK